MFIKLQTRKRNILATLTVLLYSLLFGSNAFAQPGIWNFEMNDQNGVPKYKVQIFRNSVTHTRETAEEKAEAIDLASRARDWSYEKFREFYPDFSDQEFEEMKQIDQIEDPRVSRVVISKFDEPGKIVGTLKIVYDDGRSELPIDKELGHIERHKPKFAKYLDYDLSTATYDSEKYSVVGGLVQMMEFVVDTSARQDLNAVLIFASEVDLWYKRRGDFQWAAIPENLRPSFINKKNSKYEPLDGQYYPILPETYVLYCAEKMIPYYEELGFRVFKQQGKLFGMRASRETFTNIPRKSRFFTRTNARLENSGLLWRLGKAANGTEQTLLIHPPGDSAFRHGRSPLLYRWKNRMTCDRLFAPELYSNSPRERRRARGAMNNPRAD